MRKCLAIILGALTLIAAVCLAFSAFAAEPVPGQMHAMAIYGTPQIDGVADDIWDNAQINYLNHVFTDDKTTTPSVTRFRAMWDEDYVYFLIDVKDETMGDKSWESLQVGSNLWKRDSVALTFSPDYNRGTTTTQVPPAFWFVLGAYGTTANFNSSFVSSDVWISEDGGATKMFAITHYTDETDGKNYGYTVECKVNLSVVYGAINMSAGTKIGLDVYNNNNNYLINSNTRNYGLTWGGSLNSYKNDAEKGTLEFAAKTVKFDNSAEDLAWDVTPSSQGPKLNIERFNVSFRDSVVLKYGVTSKNVSDIKLLIWTEPQDMYVWGTQSEVLTTVGTSGDMLVFDYTKLAAKQMTDVVYARAYARSGNEEVYSDVRSYSILEYVYTKLGYIEDSETTDEELIDLLEIMLEYGAAAQKYLNYGLDRLATDEYYQVIVKDGTLADGTKSGLYKSGTGATLVAPAKSGDQIFSHWVNGAGQKIAETQSTTVTVTGTNQTYTAKYKDAPVVQNPFDTDADSILSAVPACAVKAPDRIIDSGDSAYQVYMNNTGSSVYSSYVSTLLANGFKQESNRTVNGNLLGVYTNHEAAVTVYHTPYNKATRIIADPIENHYVSSTQSYKKVTTPMMTMIGGQVSQGNVYLGVVNDYGLLCILIRLSDGRFIVLDGGIVDNAYGSYSQSLYKEMKAQAVDPNNITIAAWIFSHSHSDHVGGFCSFAEKYSKEVKLESILYNFPSDADSEVSNDGPLEYARFRSHVKNYYSYTPLYKVHTGHVYTIADATIEIFYTHEDYVNMDRTIQSTTNWNNTSLIFGLEIAGQKIMFLGDAQEVPNNQTAAIFGSALKSDIVQVAHHGGKGGTDAIYKAIDPQVALFTTSDEIIPTYMVKFPANSYLVNDLNLVEYYNAHNRITRFALPYTPKFSGFVK